jgi:hypothetical protein
VSAQLHLSLAIGPNTGNLNMGNGVTVNLMNALILFSTAVTSVGLGIVAAYGSVVVFLQSFGGQRKLAHAQREIAVSVLVPNQSHASGD